MFRPGEDHSPADARRLPLLIAVLALTITACGDGMPWSTSSDTSPPEAVAPSGRDTTTPRKTATKTTPSAPSGEVSTLDGAASAVVRIEARGTFVDPVFQAYEFAGSGSGFIIDPSGIAVTNNHVVTGAGILQVYVGEDQDSPLNARVLAVSGCSDLAVIDIEGDGFPYLSWYDGEIRPGIEVFSAGFPLGTDEYTLTRGIVSKSDTVLESAWASVDHVIEHDSRTRPGDSGGPLLTSDGYVIGVNYAGEDTYDFNYAISVVTARELVERLREGSDVDSLGINGSAVYDDQGGPTGVWVASVESGSPADLAGILPGDVLLTLEGISLSTDGTMAEYCDVIRTHAAGDVLAVEVLRHDTGEFFEGQINGTPLAASVSFANELSGTTNDTSLPDYTSYMLISDNMGTIEVHVPSEWSDIDGASYTDINGNFIFDVTASPDLDGFQGSWDTPGVSVAFSEDLLHQENETDELFIDSLYDAYIQSCDFGGRKVYEDPLYHGWYDIYENCGGVGTTVVVLGVMPSDLSYLIVVQFQAVTDRDFEALDTVLDTFVVVRGLP